MAADDKIMLPDFVGKSLNRARLLAEELGIRGLRIKLQESDKLRNQVIEQTPVPGKQVQPNQRVSLTVAGRNPIHFLPAIYQFPDEAGTGAGEFLRQFLWLFQHPASEIESALDDVHTYFDANTTPPHFLNWLANWLALTFRGEWPDDKKREIILRAAELYRKRGTSEGLNLKVKLFLDVDVEIKENYWPWKGFRVGATTIGVDSKMQDPLNLNHAFVVDIPLRESEITEVDLKNVHTLVEDEKPAHARYCLLFQPEREEEQVHEFLSIGVNSRIGVAGRIPHGRFDREIADSFEDPDENRKGGE